MTKKIHACDLCGISLEKEHHLRVSCDSCNRIKAKERNNKANLIKREIRKEKISSRSLICKNCKKPFIREYEKSRQTFCNEKCTYLNRQSIIKKERENNLKNRKKGKIDAKWLSRGKIHYLGKE